MRFSVACAIALPGLPTRKMGIHKWLQAHSVCCTYEGKRLTFALSDLPEPARRAYVERQIETSGLPSGDYDDAAHAELVAMPAKMRVEAERKAEVTRVLLTVGKALPWSQKLALVKARFGSKGVSQPSLSRLSKAVEGVAPINFAPAILAEYRLQGAASVTVSDAAWSFFVTTIRHAGEGFPLQQAWSDVRDVAPVKGWHWPSWPTVYRRWKALPLSQQLHARIGHVEAARRLAQPALRDKTTILPLEWVSLDGQTKDFWAHNGDGKPRRYTFLPLVDCATASSLIGNLPRARMPAQRCG